AGTGGGTRRSGRAPRARRGLPARGRERRGLRGRGRARGALVDSRTRTLYDVCPARRVLAYQIGKLFRGAPSGFVAVRFEALLEERGADRGVDGRVELVDDRARQAGGRDDAGPCRRFVAGYAGFGDGRDVGEAGRAPGAADADRAHAAGPDVRRHRVDAFPHHLDVPGDQVVDGHRTALVRHVHDLRAGHVLEQLAGDVARLAVAR